MHGQNHLETLSASLSFWDKLSSGEREKILAGTKEFDFPAGSVITGLRDTCPGVFLVKKGSVRCSMLSEGGKDFTLFRLTAGDICILSAACILSKIRFEVNIETECECGILVINLQTFSELAAANPLIEIFSYKIAAERFSDVIEAVQRVFFRSLDEKLAAFLLDESERLECADIYMTHEQIARYIGSSREAVSRMLKRFSAQGLVKVSRKGVKLTDISALQLLV